MTKPAARKGAIEQIQQGISRLVRQVQIPAVGALAARGTGVSLGGPYYQALTRVVRDGPITISAMARDLGTDVSVVSRHVTALEKRGLVRRQQDDGDRRSFLVTATEEGKETFSVLRSGWIATIDSVISDWPDEKVEEFADGLTAFGERLSAFVDEAMQENQRTRRL
jgi:DNA-binding MarR family transcriptional regulator